MSNFVLLFSLSYIIVNEDVVSDWIEIEKNQILQSHQSDHSNQGWQNVALMLSRCNDHNTARV